MSTRLSMTCHGRGAEGPVVGGVQEVDYLAQLPETDSLTLRATCASLQASFCRDRPSSSAVTGK